jgi:hypothetical protein
MRPLVLLLMTLALTVCGSALAEGEDANVQRSLTGVSVTCSASLRDAGCFVERPVLVLGALEVALGMDARASWTNEERGYLAPYGVIGWYGDAFSAWLEFHLPETGMPLVGKPDPFRIGFTWRY